jgi:3-hydroxybutyryl-CoA dehydrogenase
MTIKNIVIFGSGMMGGGVAQIFALHPEYNVYVYTRRPQTTTILDVVKSNLDLLIENGMETKERAQFAIANIQISDDFEGLAKLADFVIECWPEDMEMKQNLFKDLEQHCRSNTIFATNTSVMSITEIASKTQLRDRVIGTHFWNPAFLIPLVEVVRTHETSEEVIQQTMDLMSAVGKHPIRVNKDVPGFVANRLQHALWREAISIVENGIADAKTVDESIKFGFGLRLPILAPMENADMVGTDLTFSIHNYILKHLESSPEPSPLLVEKVKNGELGFKSGKGFQEWTPEEIAESRRRLIQYLIDVTKANSKKQETLN